MPDKIDLSGSRRVLLSDTFHDISNELKMFDSQKCTFYYDESNNIRKLWLNEDDFNAPIDSDFVLGGVMHFGDKSTADVDDLKSRLQLQKSAKEIKFKYLSRSKSFLESLNDDKVLIFLQWLYESDLYIHFSSVNNLYYAIVDIVDSIDNLECITSIFKTKNELYKLVRKNYNDFYRLLVCCNYPNIRDEDIEKFYNHILEYIDRSGEKESFDLKILRRELKTARKQKELLFLQGNREKTILEDYSAFYIHPIGIFPYAEHIFDNEYKIEEVFAKYDFYDGDRKLENYKFINSINMPLIQVSDCVVGLIGKYYTYVNSLDRYQASQMFKTLSGKQQKSLHILAKLILKSEQLSKLLIHSIESSEEHFISGTIIQNALLG